MDAEKEAFGLLLPGVVYGQINHSPGRAAAVKTGEEVNAAEFEVGFLDEFGREIGRGEERVADRGGAGRDFGQPCAGVGLIEKRCVDGGNVFRGAMGNA
jgi:hypothetical protein